MVAGDHNLEMYDLQVPYSLKLLRKIVFVDPILFEAPMKNLSLKIYVCNYTHTHTYAHTRAHIHTQHTHTHCAHTHTRTHTHM